MGFQFLRADIRDVILIEPKPFKDSRGMFMETYKRSAFLENGISDVFVQDNCSVSKRGVIRGLHYQKNPKAQGKLVTVLKGEVFDVAVDIRRGSPTYGKWVGALLSSQNFKQLYVPPGFAHGFCALSNEAVVFYKVTEEYSLELDRGILWSDPKVGISWPLQEVIVSERDTQLPPLERAEHDFIYREGVNR